MSQKILLADDSITIQKVIELTFSDEDFDVVTVGNGRLALEKLPEVRPDIVLCDIIMPEKDGYEVCEQIKASSAFSHVPVLLLTGAFEPFDQERASQVGSDGFLAKPFEPETLIAKVKDLLRRAGVPAGGGGTAAVAPAPVVEMVAPQPAPSEPSASSPGFIPDEPFEPIDARDFEEAPSVAAAPAEAPLAAVTAEESATLAGEVPAGESHADSSSTVMFKAGDLPWTGGSPESPAPPVEPEAPPVPVAPPPAATETTEPEPVFTPEPVEATDLADAAGAAFEEVLEEDTEFGGGLSADSPRPFAEAEAAERAPSGSALADSPATQTQAPTVPDFGARDESPTLKVAVPAIPGDAGHSEPPPAEPVETFAPLAPSAPEPPPVFAPEPPAAGEPEPVETFEPVAPITPEPPQVFAPEPERQTFEPVAEAAPVFEPEPEAEPEPESAESFESVSPTAPEVGSIESFEPMSAATPEPIESLEPMPPATPEPIESFEPMPPATPEPVESFEPMPPATPEPVESFEPMPPATPEPIETFAPEPPSAPEPPAFEPAAPTPLLTEPESQSVEAFEPVVPEAPAAFERDLEPEATFEPAPPPAAGANVVETLPPTGPAEFAGDPTPPPALDPEPPSEPVFEPEPEPVLEPEPEPEPQGGAPDDLDPVSEGPGVTTLPGVARKDVVESFADLEPGDEPDPAAPSSQAASVPVPVDMVEKIAQRVISQVSEKAVREIAWEVIPDLAEALIKQEIERLKVELQKL